MSKVKSIIITVLLSVAVAVAAFFAVVSFPVNNNVNYLSSVASNIHLGADFTGYAYTTVYPEDVITMADYQVLNAEERQSYEKVGSLYANKETYTDIEALKTDVAADAKKLNDRFGQKGYSSYSVAVEDGISIKISVPTNYTYHAYKYPDHTNSQTDNDRSTDLSAARAALGAMTAHGNLTLRTKDTSITLTDANGTSSKYDTTKYGKDEWVDKAEYDGSKTYSLARDDEDVASYFSGVSSRSVGSVSIITLSLTKEGREKMKVISTRAKASDSQQILFFVGDSLMLPMSCEEVIDQGSISLQTSDASSAQNVAITLNSAVNGGDLKVEYKALMTGDVYSSSAPGGELAAVLALVACALILAGVCVFLVVKYKRLGGVMSLLTVLFALIELYALMLLSIQVTVAVLFACVLCLALFQISNVIVIAQVKKYIETGRTLQASIKEAYKHVIMTVSDMHIVLVIVAILLATVGVGEVAACGLISIIGVVASYVLYWFTRFMWYVTSSPVKNKFKFAGLKRVEYEDD